MGVVAHSAIVVTSWNPEAITAAASAAERFSLTIIGPSKPLINGYASMMVCPDGSKEGWTESNTGDANRRQFVAWLDGNRYEDGSSNLHWVEIRYGDLDSGDAGAEIVDHVWRNADRPTDQMLTTTDQSKPS